MGWDIVFRARFGTPEMPLQRFGRIYEALRGRPSFLRLESFGVFSDPAMIRPLARLGDRRTDIGPVTHKGVQALLQKYSSDDAVAASAAWHVVGERDGVATVGSVIISALGPVLREQQRIPADVLWDVGDSRRFTAEGRENEPNVAQVMADISVLVEVGAESIWGVDSSLTISPRHLFAVFHRDPNAFHDDGIEPPFPDQPIDDETIRIVLATGAKHSPYERTLQTDAGPIIYHADLAEGRLSPFYEGLRGALQAEELG